MFNLFDPFTFLYGDTMTIVITICILWALMMGFFLGFWHGRNPGLKERDAIQWPIDHPLHRRANRDR